ncbi:MAG TPA: diguanylate cyclase [Thermodesulfobacteriota bacterium]|nr:diguanylate cyclase [Thermodesulfobacteriota bacterium]
MTKGKVLVVDDDAVFRTLCSDVLRNNGYSVLAASSGTEALGVIEEGEGVDVVITDLVMPGVGGIEVLEKVRHHNALIDVVVVTAHGSVESAVEALKKGAFDYITKPVNEDELLHTIGTCMERKKLLEENQEMRQSLKLFEVSWVVASTLDMEKLFDTAIDAMLQIVPAEAGLLAVYQDGSKETEVKAARRLDEAKCAEMARVFMKRHKTELRGARGISTITAVEFGAEEKRAFAGFSSVLFAPIITSEETFGFMLLLRKADDAVCALGEIKNAAFVLDHVSSAFGNARRYARARELAFIDGLTNLYNSSYLEKALTRELKRSDRLKSHVTVLFIDIDNFKTINDTNDHLVGSRVLVEVGKVLLDTVREVDTVIRYGGDEYVIILVDADCKSGFMVADRVRGNVEGTSFLPEEGLNIRVTVSIGVATYPAHTRDKKELIRMADRAMYKAKDISRNLVYLAPMPE